MPPLPLHLLLLVLVATPLSISASKNHHHAAPSSKLSPPPHILLLVLDDLGWNNVGFRGTNPEARTPTIDALAQQGVVLNRFYAWNQCGPSRSSLQSGRLPVHVWVTDDPMETLNPADPVSGFAGVPRNMTCLPKVLKALAGYKTAFVGKWDAGAATRDQLPISRGYDDSLVYFHHSVSYWTHRGASMSSRCGGHVVCRAFVDLWQNDGPARSVRSGRYLEDVLRDFSLNVIARHDASQPLFLAHAFHVPHAPLQVPSATLKHFMSIKVPERRTYAAMVFYADNVIAQLVQALKDKGMYDDTLVVLMSDNGGPIFKGGAANNHPLRGGKYSDLEGGVRVAALASGGVLPTNRRGVVSNAVMHIADLYATFAHLAKFGISTSAPGLSKMLVDETAAQARLPPVDSVDMWPAFLGTDETGRDELHVSPLALISGKYKLLTGRQGNAVWQGVLYPNASSSGLQDPSRCRAGRAARFLDCSNRGCLFDVEADPTEHVNLADAMPDVVARTRTRLELLNEGVFAPDRGKASTLACRAAKKKWRGFYGPFAS